MARNPKARAVSHPPLFTTFKPAGVAATKLATITLELDEYEAIRLADYESLEHEEASEMMGISRSTFTRLVERARKKMALMLVEGSKVVIDGGSIHFKENVYQCKACNHRFRVNILEKKKECPLCHSSELVDFAKGFGHGVCCHTGKERA